MKPISFMENNDFSLLQTKKIKDFYDWSIIVIIVFYGYNRLFEGISIINELKNGINNSRLTTHSIKLDNYLFINSKLLYIFSLSTPYVIKNGIRYIRNTNNLVSEKLGITVIDKNNNRKIYASISECNRALGFGRLTIKNCLLTGSVHKGYQFVYNV